MECSCLTIIVGIVLIHISKAALPTGCSVGSNSCPANSACVTDCVCNDGFKLNAAQNGCEAKVLGDVCDSTNGCTGLSNIACTNSKCECAAGYVEKSSVCTKVIGGSCSGTAACPGDVNTICKNSLCACANDYVEKTNVCTKPQVSTVVCSTTGTECSAIPFAVCDTPTNLKCKCIDGYKEDSNGGSTCINVLGTQCSGSSGCTGATSLACTNSKCTCSTGYGERDNDCKKLLNTVTCSANGKECDKLDHAECDDKGKCTCSAGFEMNVDVCTAKNSGTTLTMKLGIIVLPVLVAIHAAFKW